MILQRGRTPVLYIAAGLAALVLGAAATASAITVTHRNSGPVSQADAKRAMGDVISASSTSRADDGVDYCRTWADSVGMCRESLALVESKSGGLLLPVGSPDVTYQVVGASVVAYVSGRLTSGAAYHGMVEFVRTDRGDVSAVDPVYWADKKFAEGNADSATVSPAPE